MKYSSTISGDKSVITPVDGYFDIPANGYIWVEGGSEADTEVYMTWADWAADGRTGVTFGAYTEDEIDLSDVMDEFFPYGLLRVGDIRDEIDLNTGLAISNVERLAYTAENLETAEASGRAWEADTNYIYLERETPVTNDIELDGQYTVSDHGLEMFTGTTVPVYTIVIYGNNLKNKLERDCLTRSADLANNLTTTTPGKALDAVQGKALNDQIATLNSKLFKSLTATTDLNSITDDGIFHLVWVSGGTSYHRPSNEGGMLISSTSYHSPTAGNDAKQQLFVTYEGNVYVRGFVDMAWTDWKKLALNTNNS